MTRSYSVEQLCEFLLQVDRSFPVPLSEKQDLKSYARKLQEKATVCAFCENGKLLSMVAGYTDDLTDNLAYVAVVATLESARGRGLASAMMKDFLSVCAHKKVRAVHLYAVPTNMGAMKMYRKLGFGLWEMEGEPRPEDAHLIYYLEE